ncbi:hypothetical protein D3C86_1863690 [compost metagenome]
MQRANYVNSITKTKYEGPWQFKERDKFLLRNSDGILLVYDEETEGSPKFMKLQAAQIAANHTYPIMTINAFDLQNVAEDEQGDYGGDMQQDDLFGDSSSSGGDKWQFDDDI